MSTFFSIAKAKKTTERPIPMTSLSARHQASDHLIKQQNEVMVIAERMDSSDRMWEKLSEVSTILEIIKNDNKVSLLYEDVTEAIDILYYYQERLPGDIS